MKEGKVKFNPEKCATCKYRSHGSIGNRVGKQRGDKAVFCNYASITGITCLKPLPNDETWDMRGEDFNNCKLYRKGKMCREDRRRFKIV